MRVYVDTSVFSNYSAPSLWQEVWAAALFRRFEDARFTLVTSELVEAEILDGPLSVQTRFYALAENAQWLSYSTTAFALRDTYLAASVVTLKHQTDALHVAIASVARCDTVASWNTRQFSNKAASYNRVNVAEEYDTIDIVTPDILLQRYP